MRLFAACLLALSAPAMATEPASPVSLIVSAQIVPGFAALAEASGNLADASTEQCRTNLPDMKPAYHAAFDAWVTVSHLRFGPTEVENRAFALAFWPDPRGAMAKTLKRLIADQDPVVGDAAAFRTVSVAGRGFYALDYLLFDETVDQSMPYYCDLVSAIASDIVIISGAIATDWSKRYARFLTDQVGDPASPYATPREATQELFKALSTGLQFADETRLARPLGTLTKPRPKRAEAWRSGRSVRHLELSLTMLERLAKSLAKDDEQLIKRISAAFARAQSSLSAISDPDLSQINIPARRLKVEILQQDIRRIREVHLADLGAYLGVGEGFNALDGD